MGGYSQNSGPVYSNVSLIKRALFQSTTGMLPSHEIVLYLVKHWNNTTIEEAEHLVNLALHAKTSFFIEEEDSGLWRIKKHIDTGLDGVFHYMSGQNHPFTAKELSKKLKWTDLASLVSGLSSDLRFTVISTNSNDYWMLSDWELANDVLYKHLQRVGQESIPSSHVFDLLTNDYGMDIDKIVFAPEIDDRFIIHGDHYIVKLLEGKKLDGKQEKVPEEILEEVARSGIMVCKYIKSKGKVDTSMIVRNIFGLASYERHFELFCLATRQFLSTLEDFACNDSDEWFTIASPEAPEIARPQIHLYSVRDSKPTIDNIGELHALKSRVNQAPDSQKKAEGKPLDDNDGSRSKHYLTYYERVRGYLAVPFTWQDRLDMHETTSLVVNVEGYKYSCSLLKSIPRYYLFGNGMLDLMYDYSLEPGQSINLTLGNDFEVDIKIGAIDPDRASNQARLLDIGKLVEESRRVNKSYFSIIVEVLATHPSGMHSSILFDRVNEIRSANKNTIYGLLSANECFVRIPGRKGYWKLEVTKLASYHVDEEGNLVDNHLGECGSGSREDDIGDSVQGPELQKKSDLQRLEKAFPVIEEHYQELPELWDSFSRWSRKQPSRSYEKLAEQFRDKREFQNQIVQAYAKLVCKIASSRQTYYMDRMDLVQEGFFGLLRAAELYDKYMGVAFGNYSKYRIISIMSRKLDDNRTLIRFPAHVLESIRKFETSENRLMHEREEWPSYKAMVEEGNDPSYIREMKRRSLLKNVDYISIEQLWGREQELDQDYHNFPWEAGPLLDTKSLRVYHEEKKSVELLEELEALSDIQESDSRLFWNEESVEEVVSRRELRMILMEGFSSLTSREENVIRLRFGFDDERERTLEEVGKVFAITRERARQIESKGLRKLNAILRKRKVKSFLGEDIEYINTISNSSPDKDSHLSLSNNNEFFPLIVSFVEQLSGQIKVYRLDYGEKSMILALNYVEIHNEVQVTYVDYGEGPTRNWGEHGKLKNLIEKFLGYTFPSTRKTFIEKIYHQVPSPIDKQ